MARRKYKKTKRKLSRKVIHKTRRRTKNRVKKLSKNQSGGGIELSVEILDNIRSQFAPTPAPDPAPAPAPTKRGRFSSSSVSDTAPAPTKRGRSSVSETDSTKRAKSNPPPLSDEELGKLIINELFGNVTNVSFIQDSSRYAYILYGTVPSGTLFDTRYLPLMEVLDNTTTDRGIPLQHFCMKISLVLNVPDAHMDQSYFYTDYGRNSLSKSAVSVTRSTKEANDQKNLHDSFACIRGTSPFVPDVIAHGVFDHEQFERYISLFKSNRLAAATETGTATEIEGRVLHVLTEISAWLKQKNIEDGRKKDVTNKQNWAVDILLMEYIDTTKYQTLYTLGTKTGWLGTGNPTFNPSKIQTALLISAAQLACATGVGIILYDCHRNNILSNTSQNDVRLIDIGGAIDYSDEGGKQFTLQTFDTMLGTLSGEKTFYIIEQLCNFFGVDIATKILKKQTTKQKSSDISEIISIQLKKNLEENLDSLVDFRCGQLAIEDIHHNLIMTAFVDFMMFIVVHNIYTCQSQYTMESVYGAGTFEDFSTFLTTFRSSGPPPESYHAKLVTVGEEISKIVEPCASVKCDIKRNRLRSLLPLLPPTQAQASSAPQSQERRCAIM